MAQLFKINMGCVGGIPCKLQRPYPWGRFSAAMNTIYIYRGADRNTALVTTRGTPLVATHRRKGRIIPRGFQYKPCRHSTPQILIVSEDTPAHLPGFQLKDGILHYVEIDTTLTPMVHSTGELVTVVGVKRKRDDGPLICVPPAELEYPVELRPGPNTSV